MSEAKKRFSASTVVIVAAIVGAAAFAAGRSMHDGSSSTGASAANAAITSEPPIATTTSTALPPGHPPVESTTATTMLPSPAASAASGESSLTWKVPAKWQVAPNTSSMRLATYRVGTDAEMAVSQAGGAVDANVERWIGQFGPDAKKSSKVTTKKVSGLEVTIVEVEGNFGGKEGWALLGAIVATPGMPHFFKLTGPAKTVKAARPELDELLGTLATR